MPASAIEEESMIHKKFTLPRRPLILTTACAVMVVFCVSISMTQAGSDSSCVSCHLDAAKLQKNLKVEKKEKSALQSGAG